MRLENTFEGGTPGQPITTGNSGGTSGTAFTYVDDADGAAIYSSTRAAHGSLSCEVPPEAYPVLAWDGLLSGSGDRYARVYLWIPPDDSCHIGVSIGTDDTDWTADVIGDESGCDLVFSNYNYLTGQWTGQVDFPIPSEALGQWIRVEFRGNNAASGSGEVRLFTDADGTVPAATAPLIVSQPVASWTSAWVIALTAGKSVWIDDFAVSDEGWIGPAVLRPPRFRGWGIPI